MFIVEALQGIWKQMDIRNLFWFYIRYVSCLSKYTRT